MHIIRNMPCRNREFEPDWDEDIESIFDGEHVHLWATCVRCGDTIYASGMVHIDCWDEADGGPEDFYDE